MPDYALTRASGDPLYTLVNPVDDALMKITHVLRGDDLLSSTPRQIALYQALIRIGVTDRSTGVRAPARRARRGHQEAVQARPAVQPVPAPRPRFNNTQLNQQQAKTFFARGIRPTGSRDPFALRRAALQTIQTVLVNGTRMSLGAALEQAKTGLGADGAGIEVGELLDFFADRLKVQQREAGSATT